MAPLPLSQRTQLAWYKTLVACPALSHENVPCFKATLHTPTQNTSCLSGGGKKEEKGEQGSKEMNRCVYMRTYQADNQNYIVLQYQASQGRCVNGRGEL